MEAADLTPEDDEMIEDDADPLDTEVEDADLFLGDEDLDDDEDFDDEDDDGDDLEALDELDDE
jgi:hypothetical protein